MKPLAFRHAVHGLAALSLIVGLSTAIAMLGRDAPAKAQERDRLDAFQRRVLPLLERYCVDCHSSDYSEAGIVLDRFADQRAAVEDGTTWLRVLDALEGRIMPPADMPQPMLEEFETVIGWIENDFLAAKCGEQLPPAPVVIRRLNRQEYDNTIRDLLGLDLRLAEAFPQDEIGFGYDNVGSALNISPAHVEKYIDAAEIALDQAIVPPDAEGLPPIELIGLRTYPLPPNQAVEFEHTLKPGLYVADFSLVRVGVAESVRPPRLVISFGTDSRTVDAVRVQDETVVYHYWLWVAEGDKQVRIALAPGEAERDDVAKPKEVTANVSGDQRYGGNRGLHVDSLVVRGPVAVDVERLPEAHRTIVFRTPGFGDELRRDCAREVIAGFAERAFRRPLHDGELDRLMQIFELADGRGESFERSVQIVLTTVLASPQFLYLAEPADSDEDRPLNEFELASRLSYFLWSSMPDDALFEEARAGTLRANLSRQVDRMLADPKSDAFVANFVGQWLQLRKLAGVTPDANLFPGFDDALRDAMRAETEQFFAHVLRNNRSALDLLDADYTFVNETLARHYGIEGVRGDEIRQVPLADSRRGGVLTQASVLTLTSNPNRTSPVKRGQWILQQILGTPPPPPPPDVPKLDESKQGADAATLRERLEVHRANPECATCHQQMDPLGFALENYDAVGRWRSADGVFPVDPSGELIGGRKFADAQELKLLLRSTAGKKFARNLVKNLLTYALGRGLDAYDYCTVEEIRGSLAAQGYPMRELILGVVKSQAFQYRGVAR
jgi:hypothetical protein